MVNDKKRKQAEVSDEYTLKRQRNNEAVKKSREKSKQHAKETQDRVEKLRKENEKLRHDIRNINKNLQTLKELFVTSTSSKKESLDTEKIRNLIKQIDDTVQEEEEDDIASLGSDGNSNSDDSDSC